MCVCVCTFFIVTHTHTHRCTRRIVILGVLLIYTQLLLCVCVCIYLCGDPEIGVVFTGRRQRRGSGAHFSIVVTDPIKGIQRTRITTICYGPGLTSGDDDDQDDDHDRVTGWNKTERVRRVRERPLQSSYAYHRHTNVCVCYYRCT